MSQIKISITPTADVGTIEDVYQRISKMRALLAGNDDIALSRPQIEMDRSSGLEQKAEPVTMTALMMAFITGGAATALIAAIRAVHPSSRDSSVEYSLELNDGRGKLNLKAANLTRDQTTAVLEKWSALAESINNREQSAEKPLGK